MTADPVVHADCRHFTGYRPCRFRRPCGGCPHHERPDPDVLLVNLDAMGDVLRTTALLPAIRRAHPRARITWLTRPRAAPLLECNPLVDRVLAFGPDAQAELGARRFDLLLCADKGAVSGGIARTVAAGEKRGFGIDPGGAIVPLNPEARFLYATGLDDELKFRRNRRPMTEMLALALGFAWARDPYSLVLREDEAAPGPRRLVGFNTGSSPLYPLKKLPLAVLAEAIRLVAARTGEPVLLLGGPEDAERNDALARELGPLAEATPTALGLRRGAAEVDRCEVAVTGDSLGLHLAVALGKHVVAAFGLTCPWEIDLYDRGVKLLADVECAPCWRRTCDRDPLCVDRVPAALIAEATLNCLDARRAGRPIAETRGGSWG